MKMYERRAASSVESQSTRHAVVNVDYNPLSASPHRTLTACLENVFNKLIIANDLSGRDAMCRTYTRKRHN